MSANPGAGPCHARLSTAAAPAGRRSRSTTQVASFLNSAASPSCGPAPPPVTPPGWAAGAPPSPRRRAGWLQGWRSGRGRPTPLWGPNRARPGKPSALSPTSASQSGTEAGADAEAGADGVFVDDGVLAPVQADDLPASHALAEVFVGRADQVPARPWGHRLRRRRPKPEHRRPRGRSWPRRPGPSTPTPLRTAGTGRAGLGGRRPSFYRRARRDCARTRSRGPWPRPYGWHRLSSIPSRDPRTARAAPTSSLPAVRWAGAP